MQAVLRFRMTFPRGSARTGTEEKRYEMKITILMGSPNRKGSTHLLAESFKRGAEEAGHTCEVIDVCRADLHPCIGCVRCGYEGPCAQKDDMEAIRGKLLRSDMVVFATPLYYYGMSAQLKALVDRFCAFNSSLNRRHLKSALLAVAWNADDWTFETLTAHYKTLVRYIRFEDEGMVLGYGCGTPEMTERSGYPEQAYQLGKRL
jgi:putative NADPH-quinone reductase